MNKLLRLGITVDGIIRDKIYQFDSMYRKKYIRNEGLVKMNEYFEYVDEEDNEDEDTRIENLIKDKIHLPVSTTDLTNHYDFKNETEFLYFQNVEYVLQIFGVSPSYPKAMDTSNRIQFIGEEEKKYSTTLLCEGTDQVITSTYHFMTKNACRIKNISFTKIDESLWNHFDILITDQPSILDNKPSNKLSIKINHLYNKESPADLELESLKDFSSAVFLEKIKTIFFN